MKSISIVVPAYNEEACLPLLIDELSGILKEMPYRYELIIVDDGSSDNTFGIVREYSGKLPFVKGISLSRNMGHQSALDCGLNHARGDAVISMDADLQHPPALIPELIRKWEEGYDIVSTSKTPHENVPFLYSFFSRIFYRIFNRFSQIKLTPDGSDFRLLSRRSLKAVLSMKEYHKFYRGMVQFVGFRSTAIEFQVQKRAAGNRKYTFRKSLRLASDGLVSFSEFGLKIPFFLGIIVIAFITGYLLYNLAGFLFFDFTFERGWTSIMVMIILSMGLQFLFIGMLGLYIGKIFIETKKRPVYFTQETVGDFEKPLN
jgi:glycosyltransferase involved in cell wall biosynthesis